MNVIPEGKRRTYLLIVATVVFSLNEEDAQATGLDVNSVLPLDGHPTLNLIFLAKAQAAAQEQFIKKFGPAEGQHPVIRDVVIRNIIFLGEFNQAEWMQGAISETATPVEKPTLSVVKTSDEEGTEGRNAAPGE